MARRKDPQRKPREPRVSAQAAAAPAPVAPNYAYWREHGREWPDEYDQRKRHNVAYHVQEIMLSDYFAHSAPARVLEVGCGPGRHLRYLNDLPGIEVHGYDQSASMAEGVRRWASQEWFAERIVVGEPTGRLPYPDRSFDVVFTAEVLVHVRPEHLEGVLAELARVASWQVLHLETSHDWELHQVAHEGCWKHDLVAAYGRLGLACELLPRGYAMHTPHRVVLDRKRRPYTWPTGSIALLARMEAEMGRGWQEIAGQCEQERRRAEGAEARAQAVGDRVSELIRQLDEARQRARQAEARGESQLGRLQTLSEALEKQAAAARERASADAAARQKQEDRAREAEARGESQLGRIQSLGEALDKQIAAAQERAAKDAETRRRLEERASALERQVAAAQERGAALERERQGAERKASDAAARLGALQEQIEKERARAREAEARGEAWRARLESAKEALGTQITASQEHAAKDAEARRRLEERMAELRDAQQAALAQAGQRESRIAALQAEVEHERRRSRDAEACSELHASRVQQTKEKLAEQVAGAKQGAAQLAELRKRHERALEREKSTAERFEREHRRARDAEGRCELYLARIEETRTAAARELERRGAELERERETARAEEGKRSAEASARAEELAGLLAGAREDLQRIARERATERREEDAKRRRLAEQLKAVETRQASFLANLGERLRSRGLPAGAGTDEAERALLERAQELGFELAFVKQRASYRMLRRLRRTLAYRVARWLPRRNRDVVSVRALGTRSEGAGDCEVWLLAARSDPGGPAVPWDFMAQRGTWHRRPDPGAPYGEVLMSKRGRLRFPLHGETPVLTFLKHPWSGRVEVRWAGRREVFDLHSQRTEGLDLYPAQQPMALPARAAGAEPAPAKPGQPPAEPGQAPAEPGQAPAEPGQAPAEPPPAAPAPARGARAPFHEDDRRWLERLQRANARVLALHVPRWLGVSSSTRILFEHVLAFPRSAAQEPYHLGDPEVRYNAELILASGVRHVVASGGDEIHFKVLREVKRRDPSIRCDLLWHSSYVQMTEDYQWALLRTWVEGSRAGIVDTVGTVKQGMERFFEHAGIRSRFVMNWVPEIPSGPSTPRPGGPHLGIWISGNSYRKLPYAMLAAVKMIPGAVLHGSNFVKRVRDAIDLFEIPVHRSSQTALPQPEMLRAIRDTHLTLYVTFSECSPMLPLESFSVGTPCLVGPTSHLFEDDEFLRSRLVVPAPDRADVIAQWIEGALAEREAIVRAYQSWAPQYNARARASLEEFLRG